MRKFALFFLLLLISVQAFAQPGPEETKWWQSHFGVVIDFSHDFYSRLDDLAQAGLTPECHLKTQALLKQTHDYAELASKEKRAAADSLKQLRALMPVPSLDSDDCSRALVDTYLLASIYLSGPDFTHMPDDWTQELPHQMNVGNRQIIFRNLLVAALMVRSHEIFYLTDKSRPLIGANWALRDKDGAYELSGAYECESVRIFIDPNQGPFDLGAIFNHEFSHFLRDKIYTLSNFKDDFLTPASGDEAVAWRRFLTMDETLAALNAAQTERLQTDADGVDWTITPWIGHKYVKNPGAYRAKGDFTFISPKGQPLEDWYQSGSQLLPLEELTGRYSPQTQGLAMLDPYLDRIFQIISNGYFPGTGFSQVDFSFLTEKPFRQSIDVTMGALDRSSTYTGPSLPTWLDVPLQLELQAQVSYPLSADAIILTIYEEVNLFEEKLNQPSELCTAFDDAAKRGLIDSYIGKTFGVPSDTTHPGIEGSRPGIEGSRPDIHVRPCLDFSRSL